MNNETLRGFRDAILGAQNINVPGAGGSPNMIADAAAPGASFVNQAIGNLQGLARGGFQLGASRAGSTALGGAATAQANQEEANARLKLQQLQEEESRLSKLKEDLNDPSKYYRRPKDDGGWDFFAPDGTAIPAQQYAFVKGQHVTDVLKGSQAGRDQEFLQDYSDILELGKVMQNNDKKALQNLYKKDPSLKGRISGMSYNDIVDNFRGSYPEYFQGAGKFGGSSYGGRKPAEVAPSNFQRVKNVLGGLFGG